MRSPTMSAQQTDAEMEEVVDYGEQAKQELVAKIDPTATQIPLMAQLQIYTAMQEPNVQSNLHIHLMTPLW